MANPYHDKEGKFTSKGNQGSADPKQETKKTVSKIQLKPGVDLSNFPKPQNIQPVNVPTNQPQKVYGADTGIIDTSFELTMPTSVEDAMAQGNKILGSSVIVAYEQDTKLEQAFEMNKGLKAVVSEFPRLFEDKRLLSFGTKINDKVKNISYEEGKEIIRTMFEKPEYDAIRQNVKNSGMDLTTISKIFATNFFAKSVTDFFNFKKNKTCGGVTVANAVGAHGRLARTPDTVQINPNHMRNDLTKSNQVHDLAVSMNHWFPRGDKTPTFATTTHELGHHCYNQLHIFLNDSEQNQLSKVLGNGWFLLASGEISGYASTSPEEEVAEAFSDYFCRGDGATKTNKNIVKFLKGVYDRVFGTQKV